ncbi:hypothetical protein D9613_008179 [Agrocybe pediades]|uniref:Nephrocystin 3-like N-terminal domain-containing protein n=1 Tax=Agrocybe pediades TaxID=84607 RepID=A0A8H4VK80_9AGAR|nr:hypothetical protein D9613_008179 [Agrocybe pediades]
MISLNHGVITGGNFTQINHHGQKAPIDTLKDAVAVNAFHNSAARFDPPKCHPRTRVKILDDIMTWILGQGQDTPVKPFLWLNGAAGAGKSAIAQSTIERCIERGLSLSSFFFNKSDPTRNHARPLIATLAYQLYCAFPETEVQTAMLSAIAKDPLIFNRTIQCQFTTLVVQPLKTYLSRHKFPEPQTSFLIVIDGLDECIEPAGSQKVILSDLAKSLHGSNTGIQIFVASRPEHDITFSFSSEYLYDHHTFLSLDLDAQAEAKKDIRLYLFERFAHINDRFNKRRKGSKLDKSWPAERVIEELVKKSSGQFIYAATVIRYVESTRHRPDRRLDMVLELRPHDGNHPFAELDALYAKILESSSNIEKVLEVLSLVFLEVVASKDGHSSVNEIEKVLAYDEGEVETIFCDLGALVMLSQPPRSTLKILHASLYDYLLDEARSKQFHINLRGKYIGKHMGNILEYLALYAPDYDPDSYSSLGMRVANFFIYNSEELRSCTIPPELPQVAFLFPLGQFLAPHFLSTGVKYHAMDFAVAFLHFLRIMALKDPTYSYIEDHQHRNLDTVMIHPLKKYLDDEALALVLALFCHLGSDRFVPWCDICSTFTALGGMLPGLTPSEPLMDDILSLASPGMLKEVTGRPDLLKEAEAPNEALFIYFDYMRRFLRSTSAPSPAVYAKAAKFCFDALPFKLRVPSSSWKRNAVADVTEDDPCPHLVFYDKHFFGPWKLSITCSDTLSDRNTIDMGSYTDEQLVADDEAERLWQRETLGAVYFTILGYLIFFLPRCGRSDDLIAACKRQQASYIDKPHNPFPIRWRRLHIEINNYLARVLPTSNV